MVAPLPWIVRLGAVTTGSPLAPLIRCCRGW
jgi:hypothetical protein